MDTCLNRFMFMRFLFLLSMLFLVLLTASLSSLQPLCHENERSALLQFKDSFILNKSASDDPSGYPKVASWTLEGGTSTDCCSWDGVDCNEDTGHVIGLDLASSWLYGSINSSNSLFRLLQLQSLNLADNHFKHSRIPFGVGNLLRLTYLNLSFSVFSGQIPSELSHLSRLSSIDLSRNYDLYTLSDLRSLVQNLTRLEHLLLSYVNISSTIPESLANLSSLATLDLRNCSVHGEFPTEIFLLPNLRFLRVSYNGDLTGHLPEFYSSSSLEFLKLRDTNFSGKLPTSIGNLSSLQFLNIRECHFSGFIPASFNSLTKLTLLDLSYNTLTGHIPSSSLANLTQLTYLDLTANQFSGMLEFGMFLKFKSLSWLALQDNNLTLLSKANSNDTLAQFKVLGLGACNLQKFPDFLHNQNKLRWLGMRDNNLQGLVPRWMYNVSIESLEAIILYNNSLIGFEQSPAVLPWSNLESLDLGSNKLHGSLPIPPPSTKIYLVKRNLIREMSPLICNLSSLEVLDLSYNRLSGMLPPCLGNFSSPLLVLQLQSNNFHGTIPKTWSKGSSLKMIDLSENQLQGQLPRSMANCTMLEYLNLGNNQINDTFPFWLGSLPWLKVLILRSNAFQGAIKSPEANYTFSELHIIDLSQNSFSGNLPAEYFLHWNAMKVVDAIKLEYMVVHFKEVWWLSDVLFSVSVSSKGIELEYEKIQDVLRVIDFSCNRFEGKIPELVGSLRGLHLLNLSNNALTGDIPSSLGNLTNIESMDLSQNKLLGEIPTQLTQLFSLEYFNVSNNGLTGPIPHGNQFDTFPNDSFKGNPRLCGSPLSKKCGDFKYTPTLTFPLEESQSLESSFEFCWKTVVIGYICGFVIGIVIGKIVITMKYYDWVVKICGMM